MWPTLFFQRFKLNISSISHQQAIAEHGALPNIEIFQSKDVASEFISPQLGTGIYTVACRVGPTERRQGR
jgi:hypothetical protein